MAYDFRHFRRSFDPLSRTWDLDTVLDHCPGPPEFAQSLVSIKGEQEQRWILTTWLTDDEIDAYQRQRRSQLIPPRPTVFVEHLLHAQPTPRTFIKAVRHPRPQLQVFDDIFVSCDQLGNIYFKPTEVDSQETQIKSTASPNSTQPTTPCFSTASLKLDQTGNYLKTKPALSPINGESIERRPHLQHSQLQLPPTVTANSSILLNPTMISAPSRPPPLQIPSSPKNSIPLLSPRSQPPPLPLSVVLFILLNLLAQIPQTTFTPPPSQPHFLRRVVCT
jgi:hypothetical protein